MGGAHWTYYKSDLVTNKVIYGSGQIDPLSLSWIFSLMFSAFLNFST